MVILLLALYYSILEQKKSQKSKCSIDATFYSKSILLGVFIFVTYTIISLIQLDNTILTYFTPP